MWSMSSGVFSTNLVRDSFTSPNLLRHTHFVLPHTAYHDCTSYNPISGSFSEKDWTEEDKSRDQELMAELVTIIEQRNQIVNNMDYDRQR